MGMRTTTLLKHAAPWLIWGVLLTSIGMAGTHSKNIGIAVSNPRSLSEETAVTADGTRTASTDCRGETLNDRGDHVQQ
jgi:hypothetical protein